MTLSALVAGTLALAGFVAAAAVFFVAGRYRGVPRWQRGVGASLSVGASTYLASSVYAGDVVRVANPGEPGWFFWTYPAAWLLAHAAAYHFYRQRDDDGDGPGGGKRSGGFDGGRRFGGGSDGGKRTGGADGGDGADGGAGGSESGRGNADPPDAIV